MLYRFRRLKSVYPVSISRTHPDHETTYGCEVRVSAFFRKDEGLFTFEKRENLLLNGKNPEHPADIMMQRLGDSLYPFTVRVSRTGGVEGLENIHDIRDRWTDNSLKVLEEMNYSSVAERYINASRLNIMDSGRLLNTVFRDSFVRLYLSACGDTLDFLVYNFPALGGISNFKLNAAGRNTGGKYNFTDAGMQNRLSCTRSPYGDMLNLEAMLQSVDKTGMHSFHIKIESDPDQRKIS